MTRGVGPHPETKSGGGYRPDAQPMDSDRTAKLYRRRTRTDRPCKGPAVGCVGQCSARPSDEDTILQREVRLKGVAGDAGVPHVTRHVSSNHLLQKVATFFKKQLCKNSLDFELPS